MDNLSIAQVDELIQSTKRDDAKALAKLLNSEKLFLVVWTQDLEGLMDKRVYLKTGDFFDGQNVATLYITGNDEIPPGTFLTYDNEQIKDYNKTYLHEILERIGNKWITTNINVEWYLTEDII